MNVLPFPLLSRGMASQAGDLLVGFVGLGNMGSRMAENLLARGCKVVVHDRNVDATASLRDLGADVAPDPATLASVDGMDAVLTMLPSSPHVEEVYTGPRGLLKAPGGVVPPLLIDTSTIDPGTTLRIAHATASTQLHPRSAPLEGKGGASPGPVLLDAPVSGGVVGAAAASLTFMIGGSAPAVEAARPLLGLMGKSVVHCGATGAGQAAKLCNNLALAIEMAGVAESLALGIRLGLDPGTLSTIFNTSSARCWSSSEYNPCPGVMDGVPSANNYEGGFASSLMLKDLRLATTAATTGVPGAGSPMPMAQAVINLYEGLVRDGYQDKDFSAIFEKVYGGGRAS